MMLTESRKKKQTWIKDSTHKALYEIKATDPKKTISSIIDDAVQKYKETKYGKKTRAFWPKI